MVVILFQLPKPYYKMGGFGQVDLCWRPTSDGQKSYSKWVNRFLKQEFAPAARTSRKHSNRPFAIQVVLALCLPGLAKDYFVFKNRRTGVNSSNAECF